MLRIDEESQKHLQNRKNLLAFSAGVDSSALFFLLLEKKIPFDIALVNYGLRDNAKKEEQHAYALAKKYKLKCYALNAPQFIHNFEKNARDFRYQFFDDLIYKHNYNNLLTAHQLNDQLEWFLMRLTKGAGVSELIGLEKISKRKDYNLIRPLLDHSKEELLAYLKKHNYPYFIDESNFSERYERNYFRKEFSDKLLKKYQKGIQQSFKYLKKDRETVMGEYKEFYHEKEFYLLYYTNDSTKVRIIDLYLKKLGYLLSAQQRKEIQKEISLVIGGIWAIEIQKNKIYISPYRKSAMPKSFKEECRLLQIPSKVRAYLHQEAISLTKVAR